MPERTLMGKDYRLGKRDELYNMSLPATLLCSASFREEQQLGGAPIKANVAKGLLVEADLCDACRRCSAKLAALSKCPLFQLEYIFKSRWRIIGARLAAHSGSVLSFSPSSHSLPDKVLNARLVAAGQARAQQKSCLGQLSL